MRDQEPLSKDLGIRKIFQGLMHFFEFTRNRSPDSKSVVLLLSSTPMDAMQHQFTPVFSINLCYGKKDLTLYSGLR
jgi:hypothetical protein